MQELIMLDVTSILFSPVLVSRDFFIVKSVVQSLADFLPQHPGSTGLLHPLFSGCRFALSRHGLLLPATGTTV